MSLSSIRQAKITLQTNPSRETVIQWIKELEDSNSRQLNSPYEFGGMDGCARNVHKNTARINVYKEYLKVTP
jgi:hypothetical protein